MKKFKIIRTVKYYFYRIIIRLRARKLGIHYAPGIKVGKRIVIKDGTKVFLSTNSRIADGCLFWGGGSVYIGANTSIGENSWIFSSGNDGVIFGDNVNCAANLYLIDADHGFSAKNVLISEQRMVRKDIRIGNDVWIAANVTILKGTIIGVHSVVGACSLCNKQYDDNSLICGVPAKVIKRI